MLRYGEHALWPSHDQRPTLPLPACPHCHAERIFELQLLPTLIHFLKPVEHRMTDFASIYVYTCANNCILSGASEELYYFHKEVE